MGKEPVKMVFAIALMDTVEALVIEVRSAVLQMSRTQAVTSLLGTCAKGSALDDEPSGKYEAHRQLECGGRVSTDCGRELLLFSMHWTHKMWLQGRCVRHYDAGHCQCDVGYGGPLCEESECVYTSNDHE